MKRLELKVTYRCSSKCKHCVYCSNESEIETLSLIDVKRIIKDAQPEECVIFTGGEASLQSDTVLNGMEYAQSIGVDSWLVSNGSWGKKTEYAERFAKEMKAKGLVRAYISADAFHQEFIPLQYVINAVNALKLADVRDIRIIVTFINRKMHLPFDKKTEQILKIIESETEIITDIRNVTYIGRATFELKEYAPRLGFDEAIAGHCSLENSSGSIEDLSGCSFYTVGAEGKVFICPGFAYPGNLQTMTFNEIINRKNIVSNEITAAFQDNGVNGIRNIAMIKGYKKRKSYESTCHVCLHMRNFLRYSYPDILTPQHAYGY